MDSKAYVKLAAELIDLPIPEQYFPGTVANFERTAALAKLVMDFPLPPEVEPAPAFSHEHFPE
jgi:hypothetical protein